MKFEVPETTELEIKVGEQSVTVDIVDLNDLIAEVQMKNQTPDSTEWYDDLRLELAKKYELQITRGACILLCNKVWKEMEELLGK